MPQAGGWFNLVAHHSGKCLDVYNADTVDRAPVVQFSCHNGANQRWR